jgi:hypothetical protein
MIGSVQFCLKTCIRSVNVKKLNELRVSNRRCTLRLTSKYIEKNDLETDIVWIFKVLFFDIDIDVSESIN